MDKPAQYRSNEMDKLTQERSNEMNKPAQDELDRTLRLYALRRTGNYDGRRIDLGYRDLSDLSLAAAHIPGANFPGAACNNTNFTDADLTCTDFSGANFTGANFTGANGTGANFAGANFIRANFTNAITTGANFTYARCSPKDARHIGYMGNRKVYLHNTLNITGIRYASSAYILLNPIDVTPDERAYLQLLAAIFAG